MGCEKYPFTNCPRRSCLAGCAEVSRAHLLDQSAFLQKELAQRARSIVSSIRRCVFPTPLSSLSRSLEPHAVRVGRVHDSWKRRLFLFLQGLFFNSSNEKRDFTLFLLPRQRSGHDLLLFSAIDPSTCQAWDAMRHKNVEQCKRLWKKGVYDCMKSANCDSWCRVESVILKGTCKKVMVPLCYLLGNSTGGFSLSLCALCSLLRRGKCCWESWIKIFTLAVDSRKSFSDETQ